MQNMLRRDWLSFCVGAGAASLATLLRSSDHVRSEDSRKRKILYFTRCNGFVHSVVQRPSEDVCSFSEKLFVEEGSQRNVEVICSKDGSLFDQDLSQWDTIVFYTSGNLCDPQSTSDSSTPNMSEPGKRALLDWIASGGGFIGIHACTDSFRSDGIDPYIAMLGGEFLTHGSQQDAWMRHSGTLFPEMGEPFDFHFEEEWYVHHKFARDMQVLWTQDTTRMRQTDADQCYARSPYPATWIRRHGKGRVFYTSLGHREDVWNHDIFRRLRWGAISWTAGNTHLEVIPNYEKVTPDADTWHGQP